jgi:hypothetical protein
MQLVVMGNQASNGARPGRCWWRLAAFGEPGRPNQCLWAAELGSAADELGQAQARGAAAPYP